MKRKLYHMNHEYVDEMWSEVVSLKIFAWAKNSFIIASSASNFAFRLHSFLCVYLDFNHLFTQKNQTFSGLSVSVRRKVCIFIGDVDWILSNLDIEIEKLLHKNIENDWKSREEEERKIDIIFVIFCWWLSIKLKKFVSLVWMKKKLTNHIEFCLAIWIHLFQQIMHQFVRSKLNMMLYHHHSWYGSFMKFVPCFASRISQISNAWAWHEIEWNFLETFKRNRLMHN